MSTDYAIVKEGEGPNECQLELSESSSKVAFYLETNMEGITHRTKYLTESELRASIIKQIQVLSYISEDPQATLDRFNVEYGQTE